MTETWGDEVRIERITKRYGSKTALDEVSLDIAAGEFVSLLGPSGSGKTTTLMSIAGFVSCDSGATYIGGRSMEGVPPERRNLGFVFQSYALFPHLTVARNVSYPLEIRKQPRAEIRERVREALQKVHLPEEEFGHRMPDSLSGGQRQRVALARALVFQPKVILMDEPLSALDRRLREAMLLEFRRLHRELSTTIIYVTHDQAEAVSMSDRIAVFNEGTIQQLGTPHEIYTEPANEFVANFIGEANIFDTASYGADGTWTAAGSDGQRIPLPGRRINAPAGAEYSLMVRPEKLRTAPSEQAHVTGTIIDVVYAGDHHRIQAETPIGTLFAKTSDSASVAALSRGDVIGLTWDADDAIPLRRTRAA